MPCMFVRTASVKMGMMAGSDPKRSLNYSGAASATSGMLEMDSKSRGDDDAITTGGFGSDSGPWDSLW